MEFVNDGVIKPDVSDTLYELGNVGVGQASIALGKMLGTAISIGIPKVTSVDRDIEDIIADDPEKVAIGILMSLENTLGGVVLFVVDSIFLSEVVSKLTGRELFGEALVSDEEGLSAVGEIANIMAAAYMKAISSYTGIRIYLSPVMVGVDMIGALISYPVAQLGIQQTEAICVDTAFYVKGNEKKTTAGRVIMFPNETSVSQIISAINES